MSRSKRKDPMKIPSGHLSCAKKQAARRVRQTSNDSNLRLDGNDAADPLPPIIKHDIAYRYW